MHSGPRGGPWGGAPVRQLVEVCPRENGGEELAGRGGVTAVGARLRRGGEVVAERRKEGEVLAGQQEVETHGIAIPEGAILLVRVSL